MRPAFAGAFLVLTTFCLSAPMSGQSLVPGTWSGSVTDPYGHSRSVIYRVAGGPDSLSIVLSEGPGTQSVGFAGLHLRGDTLTFTLAGGAQGSLVNCTLVRHAEGVYEGSCHDSQGRQGRMRMAPPAKP